MPWIQVNGIPQWTTGAGLENGQTESTAHDEIYNNFSQDPTDQANFKGMGGWAAPKPGEGYDDYLKRLHASIRDPNNQSGQRLLAYVEKNRALLEPKMKNNGFGQQPGAAGANGGQPFDYTQKIQEFYNMMMDPNAPQLQAARAQGINSGQKLAGQQGIRGGLAASGITKMGMDSYNQNFNQRAGMGLDALRAGDQRERNVQSTAYDQARTDRLDQYSKEAAGTQALVTAGGQAINTGIKALGSMNLGSGGGGPGTPGYEYAPGQTAPPVYPGSSPSDFNTWPG